MKIIKLRSLLCGCLFVPAAVMAQPVNDVPAKLSARLAQYKNNEPGGVLIVSRHGKTIFNKAFGVANLDQPLPVTDTTLFEAASVSKQFTATALLLLVKQGKLGLEEDARKYFPDLPDYGDKITIRQLLVHTSGLKDWRNVTQLTSWPTGRRLINQAFALEMICSQSNLNYRPGERFSYTNAGYDLAGRLIEKLSGVSFEKFIHDSLLVPAGMKHSYVRKRFGNINPGMATGYYLDGKVFKAGSVLDETYGAAGLVTTAADLQKWMQYVNLHFGPNDLLTKMRLERYVLNNGDTSSYANGGVYVKKIKGITQITHSGFLGAFRALTTYYPEQGIAVSYMGNNQEISTVELNKDVFSILFGKDAVDPIPFTLKDTVRADTKTLAGKVGSYRNLTDSSDVLQFFAKEGRLLQFQAPLHALPRHHFLYKNDLYRFSANGDSVAITQNGETTHYLKQQLREVGPEMLKGLAGSYYSPDVNVSLYLEPRGKGLMVYRAPADSVLLSPVYNDGKHAGFKGFDHGLRVIYDFTTTDKGVRNLSVHLPRANSVNFSGTKEKQPPFFITSSIW